MSSQELTPGGVTINGVHYPFASFVVEGRRLCAPAMQTRTHGLLHLPFYVIEPRAAAGSMYQQTLAWAQRELELAILGPPPPLCWKCRNGRTRAHHRRCPKRGVGSR